MSKLSRAMDGFWSLDALSGGDTPVHRLHPTVKILVTLLFIVAVISSPRYDIAALLPYCAYPFLLGALGETPARAIAARIWPALPFVLFAGLSNIIFDTAPGLLIGGLAVSGGVLACLVLMLKTALCVGAVVLLAAVTPGAELLFALRRLGAPRALTTTCLLCFRYMALLMEEAGAMMNAYHLRSPRQKGVAMRDMGPFAGQLLLRSFERAARVYRAMLMRGFTGAYGGVKKRPLRAGDIVFMLLTALGLVFVRFVWARLFM